MARDNSLPFARGETCYGGDSTLITAADYDRLMGKVYRVMDTECDSGTGRAVYLRIVKNSSGGTLVGNAFGGRGLRPATGETGRAVAGYVNAAGGFGHVMDSAYGTNTVASNDLFYVIDRGPANVQVGATNLTDSGVVVFDSAGYVTPIASGSAARAQYVLGRAEAAVTSDGTQGDQGGVILVGESFADQDTSG